MTNIKSPHVRKIGVPKWILTIVHSLIDIPQFYRHAVACFLTLCWITAGMYFVGDELKQGMA